MEVEDTTKTGGPCVVRLGFEPTVPHCNLAALIGLCLRTKLERELSHKQPLKVKRRRVCRKGGRGWCKADAAF